MTGDVTKSVTKSVTKPVDAGNMIDMATGADMLREYAAKMGNSRTEQAKALSAASLSRVNDRNLSSMILGRRPITAELCRLLGLKRLLAPAKPGQVATNRKVVGYRRAAG